MQIILKILACFVLCFWACKSKFLSKAPKQAEEIKPLPYAIYAYPGMLGHINARHFTYEPRVIALFPDSTYLFLWGDYGHIVMPVVLNNYGCLRGKFIKEDSSIFISKIELRLQTMEPRFEEYTTHTFKTNAFNPNINAFAIDGNKLKMGNNYLEIHQLHRMYGHVQAIRWDTFRLYLQENLDVKGSILEKCECTNEPIYNQVYPVEQKDSTYSKTKVWISLPKDSKKRQLKKSKGEQK